VTSPYVSEIHPMSFPFPPRGWAQCDGQVLPINQNQQLFSLLGTTYGGNGTTTFALPDLRGRVPVGAGPGFTLGQMGGEQTHTLTLGEAAQHNHTAVASSNDSDQFVPTGNYLGAVNSFYAPLGTNPTSLPPATVAPTGGGQPHENMHPYQVVNFCIALIGIQPTKQS
jgi:microcystin-dependent protein